MPSTSTLRSEGAEVDASAAALPAGAALPEASALALPGVPGAVVEAAWTGAPDDDATGAFSLPHAGRDESASAARVRPHQRETGEGRTDVLRGAFMLVGL
jgi:hypothetical protein